jgi:hypothetical protein
MGRASLDSSPDSLRPRCVEPGKLPVAHPIEKGGSKVGVGDRCFPAEPRESDVFLESRREPQRSEVAWRIRRSHQQLTEDRVVEVYPTERTGRIPEVRERNDAERDGRCGLETAARAVAVEPDEPDSQQREEEPEQRVLRPRRREERGAEEEGAGEPRRRVRARGDQQGQTQGAEKKDERGRLGVERIEVRNIGPVGEREKEEQTGQDLRREM